MKNKTILITGGTGSLGKALIKRLKQANKIIVYSRDEGKQALIFGNNPEIIRVIGDIRDYDKLNVTLQRHKVDYIIHTAALKRIFTNYDYNSNSTIFASVRYGNVIASRGSFIPLWIDFINNNKTLKVTSNEMTRFLFTLDDAVDAVLGALDNALGGEVFVPQINSYTLPTCVKALETILNKPSKTEVIGLRPGEKLHEDMLAKTELYFTYEVPNINLLQIRPQYTNKVYQNWKKYNGPEFNSALWVKEDIKEVVELINKGLKQ